MSASTSKTASPSSSGPRYQPLVIVLAAVAAGILLDRFRPLPLWAWWTLAAGGLGLWFLLTRRQRILPAGFALLLAVAAVAGAWHHCRWYLFGADDLGRYARSKSQPMCVDVLALAAPRATPAPAADPMQVMPQSEFSRLDVDVVALRNGVVWQTASGRATLLVQGPPPSIKAGDRVRCFVQLAAPPIPQNPGARPRPSGRSARSRCATTAVPSNS
jgi:hypothetical protein